MTATWNTTLRSDLREIDPLQESLAAFLAAQGASDADIGDVRLITEEVVTNIIRHGCADGKEHRIEISARLRDRLLTLRFRDDGRAFDPVAADPPDLELPIEQRPEGGLGIHLVKELAERIEYARQDTWNVLTVERSLA